MTKKLVNPLNELTNQLINGFIRVRIKSWGVSPKKIALPSKKHRNINAPTASSVFSIRVIGIL